MDEWRGGVKVKGMGIGRGTEKQGSEVCKKGGCDDRIRGVGEKRR